MDVALDTRYRLKATNPPDSQILRAGDRVVTTWKLIQAGTWLVNYQVSKIERAFESDGRARLRSYVYDPDKGTISLDTQVNDIVQEPTGRSGEIQHASVGAGAALLLGVLIGIALSAVTAFVYKRTQQVEHYELIIQGVLDDPDVPQRTKDAIEERLEEVPAPGPGIGETVTAASGALALVAAAVIAWIIIRGNS